MLCGWIQKDADIDYALRSYVIVHYKYFFTVYDVRHK